MLYSNTKLGHWCEGEEKTMVAPISFISSKSLGVETDSGTCITELWVERNCISLNYTDREIGGKLMSGR